MRRRQTNHLLAGRCLRSIKRSEEDIPSSTGKEQDPITDITHLRDKAHASDNGIGIKVARRRDGSVAADATHLDRKTMSGSSRKRFASRRARLAAVPRAVEELSSQFPSGGNGLRRTSSRTVRPPTAATKSAQKGHHRIAGGRPAACGLGFRRRWWCFRGLVAHPGLFPKMARTGPPIPLPLCRTITGR